MTSLHIHTALLRHPQLSVALDKQVLLKMENTQPAGSFKLRGIGLLCQRAVADGASHLVCPSGGNAGFAAAFAGAALDIKTTIVVPETTAAQVCQRIRDIGAEVIVHGSVWDEANQLALQLCEQPGSVYIPPFDHPDIWDGNATMIDEAAQQARQLGVEFDVVICSVGGGGLMSGVLSGLHRNGLSHIPLIAVETEGAASLNAAVRAGELVSLPAITSIATTLGAKCVAPECFAWTQRHEVYSVVVSDAQAVAATLAFADDMRTLVEPACGAALAVAYQKLPVLAPFERPLIVICGGIGVSLASLADWKGRFGL
ncbi:MAG: pyridoxal-phosphate dependent enzyme [Collimonas sp.]|uniref:pyridoxal-phosphate dependent enzyme n=1 Tax=Collimonas sp. TaxID=1963772 RepID=UPI003263CAF1